MEELPTPNLNPTPGPSLNQNQYTQSHKIKHHNETDNTNQLKEIIRQLGLKVTKQRLVILQGLRQGHNHVTAQQLFETVSRENPEIGFATVYRFLRVLAEQEIVSEVRMGGMPARYEWADKEHHDHLTCTSCHSIYEFENETIERLQEEIARGFGFRLTSHVLELYGICPRCQEKKTSLNTSQ